MFFYEGNAPLSGGAPGSSLGYLPGIYSKVDNNNILFSEGNETFTPYYLTAYGTVNNALAYRGDSSTLSGAKIDFYISGYNGLFPGTSGWRVWDGTSKYFYYSDSNVLYPMWAINWNNGPDVQSGWGYPLVNRKDLGYSYAGKAGSLLGIGFDEFAHFYVKFGIIFQNFIVTF